MKTNESWKRLVIVIALGLALSGIPAYPPAGEALAAGPMASSESPAASKMTAQMSIANDTVIEWNLEAVRLTILPASALSPVQQNRVMAIVQVAVHDAVNGITGKYATYLSPGPAPQNASPEAAAIAAAHHALRNLFSSHSASLDALYLTSLATHGLSDTDPGIEYGRSAAADILALRANDNSAQAQFNYVPPDAGTPGVWAPLPNTTALLPGWGNVTPFVLRSGSQFRPEAPPALDSNRYARDYNEIKEIGVSSGSTRSGEQTQVANFWRGSPTAIWNPALNQVVAARNLDLSETARTLALFYMAASDASVACWDAKYAYNFWRPQPAIQSGDLDGNDMTAGDGAWQPLLATPPHPEYPSGHTTASGAMASTLKFLFGYDPGVPIVVTISGITRQWDSLSEGIQEVIEARIYSGIHFRTADEVGARLGRQVARYVLNHALKRCPKRGCS